MPTEIQNDTQQTSNAYNDATQGAQNPDVEVQRQALGELYDDVIAMRDADAASGRAFTDDALRTGDLTVLNDRLHSEGLLPYFDIVDVTAEGEIVVASTANPTAEQTLTRDEFADLALRPPSNITQADGGQTNVTFNEDGTVKQIVLSDGTYLVAEELGYAEFNGDPANGGQWTTRSGLDVVGNADGSFVVTDQEGNREVILANGNSLQYNSQGQLIGMTRTTMENGEPITMQATFTYDTNGQPANYTISVNGEETDSGRLTAVDAENGSFEYYSDDWSSNPDESQARGIENINGFSGIRDDFGQLSAFSHADGRYFEGIRSDDVGVLAITVVDGDDVEHIEVGRDGVTSISVADDGAVDVVTEDGSRTYRPDGSIVHRNAGGFVTSVVYPDETTRTFTYDANNNLTMVTNPDGTTRTVTATAAGTPNAWVDPDGNYFVDNEGMAMDEVHHSDGTSLFMQGFEQDVVTPVEEPAAEEPVDEAPAEEPAAEAPAEEPAAEAPAEEPVAEAPAEEPAAEAPAEEPAAEAPAEEPAAEETAEQPTGDGTTDGDPAVGEEPTNGGDQPIGGEPTDEDVIGDEPAADTNGETPVGGTDATEEETAPTGDGMQAEGEDPEVPAGDGTGGPESDPAPTEEPAEEAPAAPAEEEESSEPEYTDEPLGNGTLRTHEDGSQEYHIQSGDTFANICCSLLEARGIPYSEEALLAIEAEVLALNPDITDPNVIQADDWINIPPA